MNDRHDNRHAKNWLGTFLGGGQHPEMQRWIRAVVQYLECMMGGVCLGKSVKQCLRTHRSTFKTIIPSFTVRQIARLQSNVSRILKIMNKINKRSQTRKKVGGEGKGSEIGGYTKREWKGSWHIVCMIYCFFFGLIVLIILPMAGVGLISVPIGVGLILLALYHYRCLQKDNGISNPFDDDDRYNGGARRARSTRRARSPRSPRTLARVLTRVVKIRRA